MTEPLNVDTFEQSLAAAFSRQDEWTVETALRTFVAWASTPFENDGRQTDSDTAAIRFDASQSVKAKLVMSRVTGIEDAGGGSEGRLAAYCDLVLEGRRPLDRSFDSAAPAGAAEQEFEAMRSEMRLWEHPSVDALATAAGRELDSAYGPGVAVRGVKVVVLES